MFGHAEAIVDRTIDLTALHAGIAPRIQTRRATHQLRRNARHFSRRFWRIFGSGRKRLPLLERLDIAALINVRIGQQAFGDDHMGQCRNHGHIGAGLELQVIVGLDVR